MPAWSPGGINEKPVSGKGQQGSLVLTSVHEAVQGAVRRPHQVDQAGLAVADRVRLWNHEGKRLGHKTDRFHSLRAPQCNTILTLHFTWSLPPPWVGFL